MVTSVTTEVNKETSEWGQLRENLRKHLYICMCIQTKTQRRTRISTQTNRRDSIDKIVEQLWYFLRFVQTQPYFS